MYSQNPAQPSTIPSLIQNSRYHNGIITVIPNTTLKNNEAKKLETSLLWKQFFQKT